MADSAATGRGWGQVSARLDWASKGLAVTDRSEENIVTMVGEDLGYTVDLEHMTRHVGFCGGDGDSLAPG
jgi:hypothetical protein